MQRRYKVTYRIGGKRLSERITSPTPTLAMDSIRKSIVFENIQVIEPPLNVVKRIQEFFTPNIE